MLKQIKSDVDIYGSIYIIKSVDNAEYRYLNDQDILEIFKLNDKKKK